MNELAGKAVVVTGAGRGLGRAYAEAIAVAGGRVIVNDIDRAQADAVVAAIVALGGEAIASYDPVGTAVDAERIISLCVEHFGAIHGLVNNAAVHSQSDSGDEAPETVERVFGVNVVGTWHVGRIAIAAMRRQGGGVVINAVSGAMLGSPDMAIYGASKAAVQSLTVSWGKECAGSAVRIVGVSPLARTPMLLAAAGRSAVHGPEVAAPVIVYLLSDLSSHLNGRTVRIADGQVSFYEPGRYGAVLGTSLQWTGETLVAVLGSGADPDPECVAAGA